MQECLNPKNPTPIRRRYETIQKNYIFHKEMVLGASGAIVLLIEPRQSSRCQGGKCKKKQTQNKQKRILKIFDSIDDERTWRETTTSCILKSSKNPHVPKIYEIGEITTDGSVKKPWPRLALESSKTKTWKGVYIIKEYVEGESLMGIDLSKFDKNQINKLIDLIFKAYDAFTKTFHPHQHVQHGDLHPGNVIIQTSNNGTTIKGVKLIDFDLVDSNSFNKSLETKKIPVSKKSKMKKILRNYHIPYNEMTFDWSAKWVGLIKTASIAATLYNIFNDVQTLTNDEKNLYAMCCTLKTLQNEKCSRCAALQH